MYTQRLYHYMIVLRMFFIMVWVVLAASCKRVCYDCKQYCSYCVSAKSGLAYKVCATKTTHKLQVDSLRALYLADSTFTCNLLQDEETFCENKNAADEAEAFYLKQDYYCLPRDL